ncbi:hypothetical protein [Virgibacillus sp. L01]|uniref:hypothetical protein n=1 Tax=Virgibacillus sp. L01 TaxID=3457429 RepID=UPI003FD20980
MVLDKFIWKYNVLGGKEHAMRNLDWQMMLFVGSSLLHDYWIYWGLPRVYYWDIKRKNLQSSTNVNKTKKS